MNYTVEDIKLARFLKSKGFNYIARDTRILEDYPSDIYTFKDYPVKTRIGFLEQKIMNAILTDNFRSITYANSPVMISSIINSSPTDLSNADS